MASAHRGHDRGSAPSRSRAAIIGASGVEQKLDVVVADRDAATAETIASLIDDNRYRVIAVTDPVDLGPALRRRQPVLVFIAQDQAEFDIARLRKLLRAIGGGHYIVSMLQRSDAAAVIAAFDAGTNNTVSRPLIVPELMECLQNAACVLQSEALWQKLEGESQLLAELAATSRQHSRRYLHAQLNNEIARARRFAHDISLVLTKVDLGIDDDRLMRSVGERIYNLVRAHIDWIARFDASTFAIVLPETDLNGARLAVRRLHADLLARCGHEAGRWSQRFDLHSAVGSLDGEQLLAPDSISSQALLRCAGVYLDQAIRENRADYIAGGYLEFSTN